MIYVLNIFVSLFSIVLVSQGWLVASNLFDAREAKRLYPLLGMGMVLGAAFGGEFTNRTAVLVGTRNLLLASAVMVVLAYVAFRLATAKSSGTVKQARAGARGGDRVLFRRDDPRHRARHASAGDRRDHGRDVPGGYAGRIPVPGERDKRAIRATSSRPSSASSTGSI